MLRRPTGPVGDLTLDVTSDDDWAAALAHVEDDWGGLDVLVNNAGVAGGGRLDVATLDEWQWITEINLFGMVRGIRTFVPMFKRQRSGHIVNVASLAGLVHPAGMASYNAVKAAVVALTETAGHELASYGVRASVVCPSYFRTNLMASMRGSDEAVGAVVAQLVERSPLTADDIAAEVLAGPRPRRRGDRARPAGPGRLGAEAGRPAGVRRRDARAGGQAGGDVVTGGRRPTSRPGPRRGRLRRRGGRRRGCASNATAFRDDLVGTPEVRQFPGGASNLTYLLRYPDRDLILRRPPAGVKAGQRPRHGPRVPDPVGAGAGVPVRRRRWSATATTSR